MSTLDRLKNVRPEPVEIYVPSWGDEKVHIMPFSLEERREFDEIMKDGNYTVMVIATTLDRIVEKDGVRVFDVVEQEDFESLREMVEYVEALLESGDSDGESEAAESMGLYNDLPVDGLIEIFEAITNKHNRKAAQVKGAVKNSRKTRR